MIPNLYRSGAPILKHDFHLHVKAWQIYAKSRLPVNEIPDGQLILMDENER